MNDQRHLTLIANPAAGRGSAARRLPAIRTALAARGVTDLRITTCAGEERQIAAAAARDGADTVVALGGDGTWGNVARGLMDAGGTARLALLAAGTGNDLAYATRIPAHDIDAALDIALGSSERSLDLGAVDDVFFVNVAGFGFDAEVLGAIQNMRWLRGHAVYLGTAARKLFGYRGLRASMTIDGQAGSTVASRHLVIVVSNGPRFGGGFLIAPDASVYDGALDVVRVADTSPWRRARLLARATRGTHVGQPEVTIHRAASLTLEFDEPPLFDADGELHRARSSAVAVRCHAGALRLAVR